MNKPFILERYQCVPRPLEDVFAFFSDAQNLEALTPSWLRFHVLTPAPIIMTTGARIDYRLRWHGIPLRWTSEIVRWNPPCRFEDVQLKGPYKLWHHTHCFAAANGGTRIIDQVRYSLPFGLLGRAIHALSVLRNIEEIFDYRQKRVCELFGVVDQ